MLSLTTLPLLIGAFVPLHVSAAFFSNWEGSHIDTSADNRAIDWWYTQVISQTAASNGIAPSIEIVLKHGNTFQFGNASNTPLFLVEVNGFDLDGTAFAQTLTFNTSTVAPTSNGETTGVWGANEATFHASADLKTFAIHLNNSYAQGTIVINSNSHYITGCGGTHVGDSPFFDNLVSDGRPLTDAEVILYKKTGWRVTASGAPSSTVDLTIAGKAVKFTGTGYKDSNWSPNAMNDFIKSWYVLIAEIGPYAFVAFSGKPTTGSNWVNAGHLTLNGKYIASQCNIIGERDTNIAVITPSGEATEAGITVPTAFNLRFVLANGKEVAFNATNIAENPSVSVYHRWVAKYTGGAPGESYQGFGLTEWLNGGNLSHWDLIQ